MPIADTELIFPEKRIFLKPLTILQLAVTLIGGLVAAVVTLWGVLFFCFFFLLFCPCVAQLQIWGI